MNASLDHRNGSAAPVGRDSQLASNCVLTRENLVRQVATALCREWGLDPDAPVTVAGEHPANPSNWETFRPESQAAICAYLRALDQQGYRIIAPKPDRQD